MKTLILKPLLLLAAVLSSATAFAYEDTVFFAIGRLEASSSASGGYRVYPIGYALPNPQGCGNADFAEVQSTGPTVTEKGLMGRALMAAFLAGKKVKLRLDGCGPNDRPAYRIVSLSEQQ